MRTKATTDSEVQHDKMKKRKSTLQNNDNSCPISVSHHSSTGENKFENKQEFKHLVTTVSNVNKKRRQSVNGGELLHRKSVSKPESLKKGLGSPLSNKAPKRPLSSEISDHTPKHARTLLNDKDCSSDAVEVKKSKGYANTLLASTHSKSQSSKDNSCSSVRKSTTKRKASEISNIVDTNTKKSPIAINPDYSKTKIDNKNQKKRLASESVASIKDTSQIGHKSTQQPLSGKKNKTKSVGLKDNGASSSISNPADEKPLDMSDPLAMLMRIEGIHGFPNADKQQLKPAKQISSPDRPPSTSKSQLKEIRTSTPKSEKNKALTKKSKKNQLNVTNKSVEDSASEELTDWEDVDDHPIISKDQVPDRPVEITLDMPDALKHKKKNKKEFDWKAYLQRRVNKFKKEVAVDKHKVHILCLLSLGMQQNEELNDLTLAGLLFSRIPANLSTVVPVGGKDGGSLAIERRVAATLVWYKKMFSLECVTHCSNIRLIPAERLCAYLTDGKITDARVWVLVFISILRAIGLQTRLILSLQAMPFKGTQDDNSLGSSESTQLSRNRESSSPKASSSKATPQKSPSSSNLTKNKSSTSVSKSSKLPSSNKGKEPTKSKVTSAPGRRLSRASSDVARKRLKENDDDDEEESEEEEEQEKKKVVKKKKETSTKKSKSKNEYVAEFSDPSNLRRKTVAVSSNRKVLSPSSSDDDALTSIKDPTSLGCDVWLEVYFPDKRKWICFNSFKGQFGKPYSLEKEATQPLSYVVAFKNDGGVKDVTPRYAKKWLSHTRKLRVNQEWWDMTLGPFSTTPHTDNVLEDDEIKGQLLVKPLPTSIGEFKNHPLYALRRHLLKFEAIYPDSAVPVGYIRQEPVYARECVRILHSRDNWLKEGRMVRIGEEPYKHVKSRPKWGRPKENPDELDLELFGEWQTEKYIPPPAVNGKVPKNEYGNVELFQSWMLPIGTVQLKVNGLHRVAKKLDIDVAQAMVGWDYHGGRSHPMFEGFVVCEEYADTLMAAWHEDQEIQEQRETERREKRVYGNWKLLIKGLLIKLRLTQKFLQNDPMPETKSVDLARKVEIMKKRKAKQEKEEEVQFSQADPATDVVQAWPRRHQDMAKAETLKKTREKAERVKKVLETGVSVGDVGVLTQENEKSVFRADDVDGDIESKKKSISQKEKRSVSGKGDNSNGRSKGIVEKDATRKKETLTHKNLSSKSKASSTKGGKGKRSTMFAIEEGVNGGDEYPGDITGGGINKKMVDPSLVSRPKRRSALGVKYFENNDVDDEKMECEIDDDSDQDENFDIDKEKRIEADDEEEEESGSESEISELRTKQVKSQRVKDADKGRFVSDGLTSKTNKLATITTEDKHWLSEDSSDEEEQITSTTKIQVDLIGVESKVNDTNKNSSKLEEDDDSTDDDDFLDVEPRETKVVVNIDVNEEDKGTTDVDTYLDNNSDMQTKSSKSYKSKTTKISSDTIMNNTGKQKTGIKKRESKGHEACNRIQDEPSLVLKNTKTSSTRKSTKIGETGNDKATDVESDNVKICVSRDEKAVAGARRSTRRGKV